MPNVELLSEENVNPEVQEIFRQLREKFGEIPAPYRAMAHHPKYLKLVLSKMEAVMGSDVLDLRTKLAIAFTVSTLNNCAFCISMYAKQLRDVGFTEQQMIEILAVVDFVGAMNHFNNGMLVKPEM